MIISTVIYIILMVILIFRMKGIEDAPISFHSSNTAKAATMIAIEGMIKFITIVYVLIMLLAWIF